MAGTEFPDPQLGTGCQPSNLSRQSICNSEQELRKWCSVDAAHRSHVECENMSGQDRARFERLYNTVAALKAPPLWVGTLVDIFFCLLHHLDYFGALVWSWEQEGRQRVAHDETPYAGWKASAEGREKEAAFRSQDLHGGSLAAKLKKAFKESAWSKAEAVVLTTPTNGFDSMKSEKMQLFYYGPAAPEPESAVKPVPVAATPLLNRPAAAPTTDSQRRPPEPNSVPQAPKRRKQVPQVPPHRQKRKKRAAAQKEEVAPLPL